MLSRVGVVVATCVVLSGMAVGQSAKPAPLNAGTDQGKAATSGPVGGSPRSLPPPAVPAPSTASGQQASSDTVPDYVKYRFFFLHLAVLDTTAAKLESQGKKANDLRDYEQTAIGLNDQETAILKEVAFDCNKAVEDQNTQLRAALQALSAQYPRGRPADAPPTPELAQIQNTKQAIIQAHIDQLQKALGPETFQKLDRYLQHRMKSAIRTLPAPVPVPAKPASSANPGAN